MAQKLQVLASSVVAVVVLPHRAMLPKLPSIQSFRSFARRMSAGEKVWWFRSARKRSDGGTTSCNPVFAGRLDDWLNLQIRRRILGFPVVGWHVGVSEAQL